MMRKITLLLFVTAIGLTNSLAQTQKGLITRFDVKYNIVSYNIETDGVNYRSIRVGMDGLRFKSEPFFQQLTEDIYAEFEKQLKERGIELIDQSVMLEHKKMKKYDLTTGGVENTFLAGTSYYTTPEGIVNLKNEPDVRLKKNRSIGYELKQSKIAQKNDAGTITVNLHVLFTQYKNGDADNGIIGDLKAFPRIHLASGSSTNILVGDGIFNAVKNRGTVADPETNIYLTKDKFYTTVTPMEDKEFKNYYNWRGNKAIESFSMKVDKEAYEAAVKKVVFNYINDVMKQWEEKNK